MEKKSKILLGAATLTLAVGTISASIFVANGLRDVPNNEIKNQSGVTLEEARLLTQGLEAEEERVGETFVHTAIEADSKLIRYAIPVDGVDIDSFTFKRTVDEDEKFVSIKTIYKKIVVDSKEYYYDPTVEGGLSLEDPFNGYYFACYSMEVQDSSVDKVISVSAEVGYESGDVVEAAATKATYAAASDEDNRVEVTFLDEGGEMLEKQVVTNETLVYAPEYTCPGFRGWELDGELWTEGTTLDEDAIIEAHVCSESDFVLESDENGHWYECSICGYEKPDSRAGHSLVPYVPTNCIGTKTLECTECEYEETDLMTEADINIGQGSYYGSNGITYGKEGLNVDTEFPMYKDVDREYFCVYADNSVTGEHNVLIKLQRVDFTKYDNVVYVYQTNSTDVHGIGLSSGTTGSDIIPYGNHGSKAKFAIRVELVDTNKLEVTANCDGLSKSYFVEDEDIATGKSNLNIYGVIGSYRLIVLDAILLNHECGDILLPTTGKSIVGISSMCSECLEPIANKNNHASVTDFSGLFGAKVVSGYNLSIAANFQDCGICYGYQQGNEVESVIAFPRVNFTLINNVSYVLKTNSSGASYLGPNSTNTISIKQQETFNFVASFDGEFLNVSIKCGANLLSWTVTDKDVIYGIEGLNIYTKLQPWNFVGIVNGTLNHSFDEYETPEALLNNPTCEGKGLYYKSCECGQIDYNKTFEVSALGHDVDFDNWVFDAINHWHQCQRGGCDHKEDITAHTFVVRHNDTDHWEECSVCGYEKANSRVTNSITLVGDSDGHHYECVVEECDYRTETEEHTFGSWSIPTNKVSNKTKLCSTCEYELSTPMVESDIVFSGSAIYGMESTNGNIVYSSNCDGQGPMIYFNNDSKISDGMVVGLPKVNFTLYDNVRINLYFNGGNDIIGFDSSNKATVAKGFGSYLSVAKIGNAYHAMIVAKGVSDNVVLEEDITDTDVLNGTSSLWIYTYLPRYHNICVSSIELNKTHDDHTWIKQGDIPTTHIGNIENVCGVCGTVKTPMNDSNIDISQYKYGAEAYDAGCTIINWPDYEEHGPALMLKNDNGVDGYVFGLPKTDFSLYSKVKFNLYFNGGNSWNDYLGFTSTDKIKMSMKEGTYIEFINDGATITARIVVQHASSQQIIEMTITDSDVINGQKCFTPYLTLPGWHNICIRSIELTQK